MPSDLPTRPQVDYRLGHAVAAILLLGVFGAPVVAVLSFLISLGVVYGWRVAWWL